MSSSRLICSLLVYLMWPFSEGLAQSLHLRERGTGADQVAAKTGAVVEIEVVADLGRFSASGIALYIVIPEDHFEVLDNQGSDQNGVQPFQPGPMFIGASEMNNTRIPREDTSGVLEGWQLLNYAAVLGAGSDRAKSGYGVVATFRLRCISPVAKCEVRIYSNPIYETLLVLSDGQGERRFSPGGNMEITVAGIPTLVEEGESWGRIKAASSQSRNFLDVLN